MPPDRDNGAAGLADRAASRVAGERFSTVLGVAETGSTNADLLARARVGEPDGTVLVADHQTAGRGRLGRTWEAPPGSSLLVSLLVRPGPPAGQAHLLTVALGLAALDALEEVAGLRAWLKWPNDLVVPDDRGGADRKLGGILAESVVEGGRTVAVVAGIGINLTWPEPLPAELADVAVAANHLVGHPVDREDVLVALLRAFGRGLADLARPDGAPQLRARYRQRCRTLGRAVRVELADGSFVGTARDVADDGNLLVDVDVDGAAVTRRVSAGDVVHLRSAGR